MMCKKQISIGKEKFLVIDLTEPLRLDAQVYPGDPVPHKVVFSDITKTGYQHHIYHIGDHHFHPHGDAPSHQNPELKEKGFEIFDLNYAFHEAVLIDLTHEPEAQTHDGITILTEIKKEHLLKYHNIIKNMQAIIIRTGYDKWLEQNKPHNPKMIPYLSRESAEYLASLSNMKVIAIDSITIDPCGKTPPCHDSHQLLKEKFIVEAVVHLHEIPKEYRYNFTLQTSAVRITGATGGPVVAYAYISLQRTAN